MREIHFPARTLYLNEMATPSLPDVRVATANDIPELMRIRAAVRENRLVSRVIGPEEILEAIEMTGRGWVVEAPTSDRSTRLAGFAVGNRETGNIWALFVDPDCEGRGVGRALHDAMVAWLFGQGLNLLWLGTEPGTRAESFYRRAGWTATGLDEHGEMRFEMRRAGNEWLSALVR